MSEKNVEIFKRGEAAYNRGDWDQALETIEPDVVLDMTRAMPEMETYRGHAGIRSFWRMLESVWAEFRTESEEITDGEDRLVARQRLRGKGRESGAESEDVLYLVIWAPEDRARRMAYYRDRAEALEAAGLSE